MITKAELTRGLLRIIVGGKVAGTGFLVHAADGRTLVLTCAHVVLDYRRHADRTAIPTQVEIEPVQPDVGGERVAATVLTEWWSPWEDADLAVLEPIEELPDALISLPIGAADGSDGNGFGAFGFPKRLEQDGIWATGEIGARNVKPGHPRRQLSGATNIAPGFSGGPVLDVDRGWVVGMVAIRVKDDPTVGALDAALFVETEAIRDIVPPLRPTNPYQGLKPFDADSSQFFHGRADEVGELVSRLRAETPPSVVALIGPSGSGKSSIVRAGLLPHLGSSEGAAEDTGSGGWSTLVTRPSDAVALGAEPDDAPGRDGPFPADVADFVEANRRPGHRSLLVIDQFEELLTPTCASIRADYVAALERIVSDGNGPILLPIMRSDFFDVLGEASSVLQDHLLRGSVAVSADLSADDITDIIRLPAERVGYSVEDDLVEEILDDLVSDHPGRTDGTIRATVLPLLEDTLTDTWEAAPASTLRRGDYRVVGGLVGTLASRANEAYEGLTEQQRSIADRVLLGLVDVQDYPRFVKQPRSVADFTGKSDPSEAMRADSQQVREVVDRFVDRRLILREGDELELAHEVIISAWEGLQGQLEDDHLDRARASRLRSDALRWQRAREARQDARQHDADERDTSERAEARGGSVAERADPDDLLMRGERLRGARQLRERRRDFDFSENTTLYIEESVKLERNQAARTWLVRGALVVAIIVALGAAGIVIQLVQEDRYDELVAAADQHSKVALTLMESGEFDAGVHVAVANHDFAGANLQEADREPASAALIAGAIARPRLARVVHGHEGVVHSLAFAPDGERFYSAGRSGLVGAWDGRDGTAQDAVVPAGNPTVQALAHHPGGRLLAGAGCARGNVLARCDGIVRVWDLDDPTQSPRPLTPGGRLAVQTLAFSAGEGRWLVTGSRDGVLSAWDTDTWERTVMPLDAAAFFGFDIPRRTGGEPVVLASRPEVPDRIRIWDVAFHPETGLLAVGYSDSQIRIWDLAEQEVVAQLDGHDLGVASVDYSPDGRLLASGGFEGDVVIWDATTVSDELVTALIKHDAPVRGLAFNRSSNLLASADADGSVMVWLTAATESRPRLLVEEEDIHAGAVLALVFSPTDEWTLVSGEEDSRIFMWDLSGRPGIGQVPPTRDGEPATIAAFSDDGSRLALGDRLGNIAMTTDASDFGLDRAAPTAPRILVSRSGRGACSPQPPASCSITDIAFFPDPDRLVTADRRGVIRTYDLDREQGRELYGQRLHRREDIVRSQPTGVLLDATATRLVSFDANDGLAIWELTDGVLPNRPFVDYVGQRCTQANPRPRGSEPADVCNISAADFQPGRSVLATGDNHGRIQIWDAITGSNRMIHQYDDVIVGAVAFDPSSPGRLYVGLRDGRVERWDLPDAIEGVDQDDVADLEIARRLLRAGGDPIRSLDVSPDGSSIVLGDRSGEVLMIDTATGRPLGTPMPGHDHPCFGRLQFSGCIVWSTAFHPQRSDLVVTSSPIAGSIVWQIGAESMREVACGRAGRPPEDKDSLVGSDLLSDHGCGT